jgi:hypothetical protein
MEEAKERQRQREDKPKRVFQLKDFEPKPYEAIKDNSKFE